tara:strand:+ start:346 stop:558 length:213 start_codon:yes stop_codon:yes gene_type:complete
VCNKRGSVARGEKKRWQRESEEFLSRTSPLFFIMGEKIKFQSKKKQGSGKIIVADKKFFDLKSPSSSYYG